ncbi:oxalate/formate antiporter family transporter [uncultured Roseburia sp.]|uniref:MFS transporter n=1 Tax=Brotonthovivens ammoniilytica TaxID=2981725 RepID=A0ABT2TF73_9FIRM|nr:MFS transporter [Brotonthovivens ammoniilytica]MCU6760843.1 MFS transporter [Brotonthovivens ammoniilytica]SCI10983.1 oxalate/formate antiporter family transporter [uncultured Roseburia sp.]
MNTSKGSVSLNFGIRGWLVIIYCFLSFVIGGAFLGVWQITITENAQTLGWNTTALFSLTNVAGIIMCLFEMWLSRMLIKAKVNIARVGIIMFAIYVIACLIMRLAITDVVIFNLMFVICYITTNGQSMMVNGVLVGNWWPRRRGMVIGLTTVGVPVGSAFGNGFYMAFAKIAGPQNVYFIYALAGLVICALGIFFIRSYPEQVGAYPDNDKTLDREAMKKEFAKMQEMQKRNPWNLKRILSTPQVWLIVLLGFVTFNSNGIFMMQSMNRLVVYGPLEMPEAMVLMTIASVVAIFGSPLCGVIDSKFGTKVSAVFICILALVCTVLQLPGTYTSIMIGMIFFGIVMGGASNVVVSLASDAFPRDSSGRAFSIIQPVMHLITMGVNEMYLLIGGKVHNYMPVYAIYIVLLIVTIIIFGAKYNPQIVRDLDAKLKAECK